MPDDIRSREALENLWALAWRELAKHRLVANTWRWADRLLVVPAAVLAVGSLVAGLAGLVDRTPAAVVALVAAGLSAVSILLSLPQRARRALNALTYLRIFTAEVAMLLNSPDSAATEDTVAELRRWYMRINAAIASGTDELRPELLEFPTAQDHVSRLRRRPTSSASAP